MGSLRLALCTGILAAAAFTPVAYAADGTDDTGVSVTPVTPAPGTDVTLEVAECAERTALAVSSAFVSEVRLTVADGVLVGESRVRSTLTAGTYPVLVDCGERARRGTIEVAPARDRPAAAGTAEPSKPEAAEPTAHASPVAPSTRAVAAAPRWPPPTPGRAPVPPGRGRAPRRR
ncbi:hypothetical protein [Streptomyces sp. H-KF8]|uniref:hypothetical protein n=1 Tax=Streptomyces sp. H-KF8 TaxID=1727216 RepID=UPI0026AD9DEF|nr:hypothetical protein [Streptomyces sp. H-KF8]